MSRLTNPQKSRDPTVRGEREQRTSRHIPKVWRGGQGYKKQGILISHMSTHHIRKPPEHIEDRVNVMYIYIYIYKYINKTVIRNYAENANEISNPKNTTSRQTKVIIRFVRFHFAFHSDNSGPIPFFFHVGKNIRWLVQRQTWETGCLSKAPNEHASTRLPA